MDQKLENRIKYLLNVSAKNLAKTRGDYIELMIAYLQLCGYAEIGAKKLAEEMADRRGLK